MRYARRHGDANREGARSHESAGTTRETTRPRCGEARGKGPRDPARRDVAVLPDLLGSSPPRSPAPVERPGHPCFRPRDPGRHDGRRTQESRGVRARGRRGRRRPRHVRVVHVVECPRHDRVRGGGRPRGRRRHGGVRQPREARGGGSRFPLPAHARPSPSLGAQAHRGDRAHRSRVARGNRATAVGGLLGGAA